MSTFAHFRNSMRLVDKIEVNFESHGARFLNDSLVDKLLIQNKGELPWKAKDSLVLSMLESLLEDNPPVIVSAIGETCGQCFLTIPPQTYIKVLQQKEIVNCPHCRKILIPEENNV